MRADGLWNAACTLFNGRSGPSVQVRQPGRETDLSLHLLKRFRVTDEFHVLTRLNDMDADDSVSVYFTLFHECMWQNVRRSQVILKCGAQTDN